jgi:transcriptional regulator with XRE-family HTH domain
MTDRLFSGSPGPPRPDPDDPLTRVVRLEELGELIRAKRHKERLTLEQAAQQIGVSAATLSRWERQGGGEHAPAHSSSARMPKTPDMRTITAITRWLGVTSEELMSDTLPPVPDVVEMHLRADRNIDPVTAEKLGRMFRLAYDKALRQAAQLQ